MSGWYQARMVNRSTKVVIALMLFAGLMVAAVPVALCAGLILMILGHVLGGLALFGGSIMAAIAAVAIAGFIGLRHLRTMLTQRSFRIVQLGSDYIS
jgi:uncharacterized membrane protein YdjX (TVP38/TMEM64 family)